MATSTIELRGVRVHNLKNIDLDVPLHRLVVVCGVSGSGKSSLAFDTLYAEGQRRFVESLSPAARQFIERLERPDADRIEHIPPAIAVRQQTTTIGNRSTVATATEIHDSLRLMFARIGRIICPNCGNEVRADSPDSVLERLQHVPAGRRLLIGFPFNAATADGASDLAAALNREGFRRAIVDGRTVEWNRPEGLPQPDRPSDPVWIVVDRLMSGKTAPERVVDSLELAFRSGDDRCVLLVEVKDDESETTAAERIEIDGRTWNVHHLSRRLLCPGCRREFAEPDPRLFNFNSPLGACPHCQGVGTVPAGDKLETCPACHGARLQPAALAVRIDGMNIADVCRTTVERALPLLQDLGRQRTGEERQIVAVLLEQMESRLNYLQEVGLGYLTLDRAMKSLSGGEAQRVSLTAALGSRLVHALYVLDEPSAGLHPRDSERVIQAIRSLRNAGNTVVVVEHEDAFIRAADDVVEIGPGAGWKGGEVVFHGPPNELIQNSESLTADFLAGRSVVQIRSAEVRRPLARGSLRLVGAREHNLKNLTVEFPLGALCVVTGVSGSGKSTLVENTLYPALCRALQQPCAVTPVGSYDQLDGADQIDQVILVDQSPIGRTPRSNPVTYLKAFDDIRRLFAQTAEAKVRNFGPRHFSFNAKGGGGCPRCQGNGSISINMQFLANVAMTCPECHGTRYRREILDARYRGQTIADVLAMTADEAFRFFRGQSKIQKRLRFLKEVGLDYVPLGQPATTLSGGESQRLKLASFLATGTQSRTLFLLDEPTTGLHPADVATLLRCFEGLLAIGHSILVIEHNLDVVRAADYVIDLGPEAGDAGGTVVAQGTPEEIAQCPQSITGRYLRQSRG